MAETTPLCEFGWKAPEFNLPATSGESYALQDLRGDNGTLIMFISNHCPFVKGVIDRVVTDASTLAAHGIKTAAICSNDAATHPDDSFAKMKEFASSHGFPFPYLHDETQAVARSFGAVCTPDFFGFNGGLELQYRGRLDEAGKGPANEDTRRDLLEAMMQIARTGKGPQDQSPSMGCSIKWKAA